MFLDHNDYQKTLLVKSETHVLGQEAHQVPQVCPMGPKFLAENFLLIKTKYSVLPQNEDLFTKFCIHDQKMYPKAPWFL